MDVIFFVDWSFSDEKIVDVLKGIIIGYVVGFVVIIVKYGIKIVLMDVDVDWISNLKVDE